MLVRTCIRGEVIMDGWSHNSFMGGLQITVSHIPLERPVLPIVGGYTTRQNLKVQNGILLCCLLPHSSRITQPLDVGFFEALKTSWRKAVDKYKISHMGSSVTKESFAAVFNTAWTGAVKMATIVNIHMLVLESTLLTDLLLLILALPPCILKA